MLQVYVCTDQSICPLLRLKDATNNNALPDDDSSPRIQNARGNRAMLARFHVLEVGEGERLPRTRRKWMATHGRRMAERAHARVLPHHAPPPRVPEVGQRGSVRVCGRVVEIGRLDGRADLAVLAAPLDSLVRVSIEPLEAAEDFPVVLVADQVGIVDLGELLHELADGVGVEFVLVRLRGPSVLGGGGGERGMRVRVPSGSQAA